MTQDTAVRICVGLVPEIEKQGADRALTDYASKEDLPPAQLEKLAQVFNTMRTVTHIDNAPDDSRGESVPLVDVPTLVVGYATGMGQDKVAQLIPSSTPSHDPSSVNLMQALRGEANPKPQLQKAAAAEVPDDRTLHVSKDAMSDALLDLELDLRAQMSKCASEILFRVSRPDTLDRDVSALEKEALYHQPVSIVKAAGDWLEKFAAPHRMNIIRHDHSEELAKRAFNATSVGGEAFAALAKAHASYDVVVKMAANPTAGTISYDESDDAPADVVPGSFNPAPAEEDASEEGAASAEEVMQQDKENGNVTPAESSGEGKKIENEDKGPSNVAVKAVDQKEAPVSGSQILGALGAPGRAAGSGVRGAAGKADEALSRVTGKERQNTAQKATDLSVADIQRSINVRRMIGTDPVLREQDPADVLEIYNSVSSLYPGLAGNMPALKLLLREAVNYEGFTLDSAKSLTDIRKGEAGSQKDEAENDKRRYAVGGGIPITTGAK